MTSLNISKQPARPSPRAKPNLTEGPIFWTLLMFSLPVLGSNILQSLNASVNSVWVGRFLGEAALTATSNANIVLFLLLGLVFGISMATSILVGQAMGRQDLEQMRRVVGTSSVFFLGLSLLVAILGYVLVERILGWMDTPAAAMPYAIAYLKIIFIALPFMYFYNFVMMALRGAGDSKTPFWFMLMSVGLDIVLNPMLIFGWGPLPEMGIRGSALATLIAQSSTLVFMLAYLYKKMNPLCLGRGHLHCLKPNLEIVKLLIEKGVPMGMQMLVISSSALVMMSLVNGYGTATTAAYGVTAQIWTYVQMPALAIGASVSAMAAQNIGAGRWDRVSQITRAGLIFNTILTGLLVALVYALGHIVFGWFLPAGSASLPIATHINILVAWSFILFGMTIVLLGVVRATGAVLAPLLILFISQWLLRIPVAAIGSQYWGENAIWWSFGLGSMMSLVLAVVYYRRGTWRNTSLLPAVDGEPTANPL